MTNREIQQALATLGYYRHTIDGIFGKESRKATEAFQRAYGLTVDGIAGAKETQPALLKAVKAAALPKPANDTVRPQVFQELRPEWLPDAVIKGIIVHWTGGAHGVSAADRRHYHLLIDGDSRVHRGTPSIALNDARGVKTGYAEHTRNCNSGFIGVSLCGMHDAQERPFDAGKYPIRLIQWVMLGVVLAELCERYGIPVTPRTVLSHAEVQPTLGIQQRGKWDISRLPWDTSRTSARAVGDLLRAEVTAHLNKLRSV